MGRDHNEGVRLWAGSSEDSGVGWDGSGLGEGRDPCLLILAFLSPLLPVVGGRKADAEWMSGILLLRIQASFNFS